MIALTPSEVAAFEWLDWQVDFSDPAQTEMLDVLSRIVQSERPSRREVNCAWGNLLGMFWNDPDRGDPSEESCRHQAALLRLMAAYLLVEQGASWAAARRQVAEG